MPSIILSFPYSGALYRYFTDQLGSGSLQEPVTHRYYRTLFGRNASTHIELALNFLLLYDEVYVTPADNHWPTSRLNPTEKYTVTELGLTADWEDFQAKDQQAYTQYLDYLCHHESITKLLGETFKLAKRDWRQILDQCIYESGLSARKRIPILCSAGRRVLIQELVNIQSPSLHPIFSRQSEVKFIESYRTLSGMALMPRNLDELMDAKPDKAVRQYGNALVNASADLELSDSESTKQVALAALEAIETERVSKLFAGGLNWATSFMRLLGQPTLAAGTTGAEFLASRGAEEAGWYEFKGSIDSAISKAALIEKLRLAAR